MLRLIIVTLILSTSACFAQTPFEINISSKEIILRSGGAEFSMNAARKYSQVFVKDHGSISSFTFMPKPLPYKSHLFKLGDIDKIKITEDTAIVKRLKIPLTYNGEIDNVDFYIILEVHKDIPVLIIDYRIENRRRDNLFFRAFYNMVKPSGGAVAYMMDYDSFVKFPINKKRTFLPKAQWQLALGSNGKGVGFLTSSKHRIYTFKHPKYTRINYLGIRSIFEVKAKSAGEASRLIVFPADTHQEANDIYEKIVKFKDKKKVD